MYSRGQMNAECKNVNNPLLIPFLNRCGEKLDSKYLRKKLQPVWNKETQCEYGKLSAT